MFAEIGSDITAQAVKAQLAIANTEEPLTVRIDSAGGSVFEGFSIYSACQAYQGPKSCIIESAAFSIASYIAMAFDRVLITRNGYMMIHNPSADISGDDEELASKAALLAKLKASMIEAYATKTKMPPETVENMMRAETFLNAEEALAAGFVDEIVDYAKPSRVIEASGNQKDAMPFRVVAALKTEADSGSEQKDLPPMADAKAPLTVKQIKAKFPHANTDFIVKAMEEEMTLEEATSEMIEALRAENEELKARLTAMEEEYDAKAKAMEDDKPAATEDEEPEAMEEEEPEAAEDEEEKPVAKAKAKSGVRPVAKVGSGPRVTSARSQWSDLVAKYKGQGLDNVRALQRANRENPALRERMLEEVNNNRG